ncbi:MAG: hypothetical protein ACO271_08065 [Burkholderiales bacterium]
MDGWLQAMTATALRAGLLGGAHCAAMCGSIVSLTSAPGAGGKARGAAYPLAWVRYLASALIAAVGIYGMLHLLQPAAQQPDSLFCRMAPGLAELLR